MCNWKVYAWFWGLAHDDTRQTEEFIPSHPHLLLLLVLLKQSFHLFSNLLSFTLGIIWFLFAVMSITFKSQDLRWADLRNSMTSLPKFNSLFTGLSPKTSKYEVLGVKTLTYEWGWGTTEPLKSTQPTVISHPTLVSPRLTMLAPRPESDWGGGIHSGHLLLLLWDCRAPTRRLRATWAPGSMNPQLLLQYRGQK